MVVAVHESMCVTHCTHETFCTCAPSIYPVLHFPVSSVHPGYTTAPVAWCNEELLMSTLGNARDPTYLGTCTVKGLQHTI